MKFNENEKQLLLTLNRRHKISGRVSCESLEKLGRKMFRSADLDFKTALGLLESRKLLTCSEGEITVTPLGIAELNDVKKESLRDRYNNSYELLELGCGNGRITEYIYEQTGAHITGIDLAENAIRNATNRTESRSNSLDFITMDMTSLDFPDNHFHRIFSIDAFYALDDLESIIGELERITRTGVEWAFLFGDNGRSGSLVPARDTALGKILTRRRLQHYIIDYTANIHRLWTTARTELRELESEFIRERNADLHHVLTQQAAGNLAVIHHASYYLYHVIPG